MSDKQTEKQTEKQQKPVDTKAFIARKLAVLNMKTGASAEHAAARVIENNRGGMNNGAL